MTTTIAEEWLHSCSGCEIALLNIGEGLLALFKEVEIVHMPMLMDHKLTPVDKESGALTIPDADIGIVSGGVANEEHLALLEEMRSRCKILIGLGTCATHGGIPAMANQWTTEQWLSTVFSTQSTRTCTVPDQDVPPFLDRVYAVDEKATVDVLIPGCPPNPQVMEHVLSSLIHGNRVELPRKSVCDTCPTVKRGKGETDQVLRFLQNSAFQADQPEEKMRCLLEQGLMCMGPVTAAGCAHHGLPRCIAARVPCRGCFGPVRQQGNQLLDMLNALASNGIRIKSIVDRKSLLRFSGGHGRLKYAKGKR